MGVFFCESFCGSSFLTFYCRPSLFKALVKAFGPGFLLAGIFKLGNDILIFSGPLLLQAIIRFVSSTTTPTSIGFLYVFLLLAASILQSVCLHQYFFIGFKMGMKVGNSDSLMTKNSSGTCCTYCCCLQEIFPVE